MKYEVLVEAVNKIFKNKKIKLWVPNESRIN
jgi:hypothetical protein